MRRILAVVLLLAQPAFAALPHAALDAPLTPVVSAPALLVGGAPPTGVTLMPALAPTLSAATVMLSMPASAPAVPSATAFAAAPISAAAPAADPPSPGKYMYMSETPAAPGSAAGRVSAADRLGAIDKAVRKLLGSDPEAANYLLKRNFDSAAAPNYAKTPDSNDAIAPVQPTNVVRSAPLIDRLLARVTLEEPGASEAPVLRRAFARILETPSGRALAERYVQDGAPAVVGFQMMKGTQATFVDGRRYFHGVRALTDWMGDSVQVRLNLAYLAADQYHIDQSLPSILAHELFGHGLWYARAARENMVQAFHHHELNETNARLIGWLVDFELDGRFEETGAWTFLQNPQGYLDGLKLRLPYYALTFSNAELLRPVETLEARLAAAYAARDRLEQERVNQRTWLPVMDHFVSHHGVDPKRFLVLRAHLLSADLIYVDEIRAVDAVIAELDAVIGRFKAETEKTSERYLAGAAVHPMFAELDREADANLRALLAQVRASGARQEDESPEAVRLRNEHWRGQIDFNGLQKMYLEDRKAHPKHWL